MTTAIPRDVGLVHFIGIGGIGMSGIAEVMKQLGFDVQGSDVSDSANVVRLRSLGIPVTVGHDADNLGETAVVVVSSAIKEDNPEVVAARSRLLPIVRRAEMLAELMRLKWCVSVGGTHGKTTTTSLIAAVLDAAGIDPTVVNGGIINAYGTNARLGGGDWMVVEADESDGTFVKLPARIGVVTNIDPEHLEHYGDFDALREAFRAFVLNVPFYGCAVMCVDHAEVQNLIAHVQDRRIITYGMSASADVRAENLSTEGGRSRFDLTIHRRPDKKSQTWAGVELAMPGAHNVQNALAAISVALELGVEEAIIRKALAGFDGVKRRFTHTGAWNGIDVYDDYAHHPVEITAALHAARQGAAGRIIAVVQPHRYSRLEALFEDFCTCFNDADVVVVADVYPAGEAPIEGADKDGLVEGLRQHGHRQVVPLDSSDDLPGLIKKLAQPKDTVVCMGAGSITAWANALPGALAKRAGKGKTS